MKKITLIVILLQLKAGALFSQQNSNLNDLLDKMVGKWILKGTIENKETTHDVQINWVLEHQYIQINEVSREKDSLGKPEYSAIVYLTWEKDAGQFSCLWLDNTGNSGLSAASVGHARPNGDKIEFIFNSPGGNTFHTTLAYDRNIDIWKWGMDGELNGELIPFARVQLNKQ